MRLFQPTAEPRIVAIHRILQRVLETELPEGRERQVSKKILRHVDARCKFIEDAWWELSNRWEIEPLRALAENLIALNITGGATLANSVGVFLEKLARYAEAEALLRGALALDGMSAPIAANLGLLLYETNRLTEAEPLMRMAVAALDVTLGT